MKRNYYILNSGKLVRKHNTIYYIKFGSCEATEQTNDEMEEFCFTGLARNDENLEYEEAEILSAKPVPVASILAIYIFSELQFNTKFITFASQNEITLHFFNYYLNYTGSFLPRTSLLSGRLLIEQVKKYSEPTTRMVIARKLIRGSAANILKNLQYYQNRKGTLNEQIESIKALSREIENSKNIQSLMGIEGNIRSVYYSGWKGIITPDHEFEKRVKHPPDNPVNSLISFGNSLAYASVLTEIHKTQLNPLISFLHEPGERRYSLSLDISEIFKPLLVDRMIFTLLNKKQLTTMHFSKELNFCYLNQAGRKIVLQEYDLRLKTTIKHRDLNKHVSYQSLIRLECFKLIKHLIGEKEYEPFKIWW
jgi:CRISPR-associated protein Cas1